MSQKIYKSFKNYFLLVTCLHTIDFKNGFAITLELIPLDTHKDSKYIFFLIKNNSSNILLFDFLVFLLFVATDKNKVQIYQITNSVVSKLKEINFLKTLVYLFKQIEQVFVLSGHEDWIRSIIIQKSSKKNPKNVK